MKLTEVPQDDCSGYVGLRRVLYAQTDDGACCSVLSSGWEIEEAATRQAIDAYAEQREQARLRHLSGQDSPLPFQMYRARMDIDTLHQTCGMACWRIRRHFRRDVFARLPIRIKQRYADALGLSLEALEVVDAR